MAESIEELIAEREKLLTDKHTNAEILSSCRAQIDAAKATAHVDNQYSDPKWFAKVTSRARYAGMEDQRIQKRLAELKELIKEANRQRYNNVLDSNDAIMLLTQALRLIQQAVDGMRQHDRVHQTRDEC